MPPPGVPDWMYPGMLLFSRRDPGPRYVINGVDMDAEGNPRVHIQLLRSVNGVSGIDNRGNNWPVGGVWFEVDELTNRFEPLGYFNQISPYPRFRQEPRRSSLSDAMQMFGNVLGGISRGIQPLSDVPKAPPPRTAYQHILEDEDD